MDLLILKEAIAELPAQYEERIGRKQDTMLTFAARMGCCQVVKYLVNQRNVDIWQTNGRGGNALALCAQQGHFELLKWLLQRWHPHFVQMCHGFFYFDFILTSACHGRHINIIEWYCKQNPDVNIKSKVDALIYGAIHGDIVFTEYLLQKKCVFTSSHILAAARRGRRAWLQHFMSRFQVTISYNKVWKLNNKMKKLLFPLVSTASFLDGFRCKDKLFATCIQASAHKIDMTVCAFYGNIFLARNIVHVTNTSMLGDSVEIAAENNHWNFVFWLTKEGIIPQAKLGVSVEIAAKHNQWNFILWLTEQLIIIPQATLRKCLVLATIAGKLDVIKWLVLEKNTDPNVEVDNHLPLCAAISCQHRDCVSFLHAFWNGVHCRSASLPLECCRANSVDLVPLFVTTHSTAQLATAMMYAITIDNAEMVQWFLQQGVCNHVAETGYTPMFSAIELGRTNCVEKMAPYCDFKIQCHDKTSMEYACSIGNLEIVEWLVSHCINRTPVTAQALLNACAHPKIVHFLALQGYASTSMFEAMFNYGDLQAAEKIVENLLPHRILDFVRTIAARGNLEMFEIILKCTDVEKIGALIIAIAIGNSCLDVVKCLILRYAVNVNPIEYDLIHLATKHGDVKMVKFLLQCGSKITHSMPFSAERGLVMHCYLKCVNANIKTMRLIPVKDIREIIVAYLKNWTFVQSAIEKKQLLEKK